jgi:hypothetical protein
MLFDWDTATTTTSQIRNRLLDMADPTGVETPGLAADIAGFLPAPDAWATLAGYHTVQRLDDLTVSVPATWDGITADASGGLDPGTAAFTVTGVRHRDGVAHGRPESSDRPVGFTMFITCSPGGSCHLLRLGQPDHPLD